MEYAAGLDDGPTERRRQGVAFGEGGVMTTTGVLLDVIDLHGQVTELGLDLGVMDLVVRKVLDLVQAQGAAIELADGDSMVYRAVAGRLRAAGAARRPARSLSGQCIATGSWLKCDDTLATPGGPRRL
jgi:hypothetical protein